MFGLNITPTAAQQRLLDFIQDFINSRGYSPSIKEISVGVSRTVSSVKEQLDRLERDGFVRRERGRARSIELTRNLRGRYRRPSQGPPAPEMMDVHRLPILGELAAGSPVLAGDNVEDFLVIGVGVLERGAAGAVAKVRGDSMEPELHDGDLVIIQLDAEPRPGQYVAARVGDDDGTDEVVIKVYRRRGKRIVLESLNPEYPPLENGQSIIGVARKVLRGLP